VIAQQPSMGGEVETFFVQDVELSQEKEVVRTLNQSVLAGGAIELALHSINRQELLCCCD